MGEGPHAWLVALAHRAWVAAESGGDPGAQVATWTQYGVLGVVAGVLIWFAKGAYARETARADRLEAELLKLHGAVAERVIPALEMSSRANQQAQELIQDMHREREMGAWRRSGRGDDT